MICSRLSTSCATAPSSLISHLFRQQRLEMLDPRAGRGSAPVARPGPDRACPFTVSSSSANRLAPRWLRSGEARRRRDAGARAADSSARPGSPGEPAWVRPPGPTWRTPRAGFRAASPRAGRSPARSTPSRTAIRGRLRLRAGTSVIPGRRRSGSNSISGRASSASRARPSMVATSCIRAQLLEQVIRQRQCTFELRRLKPSAPSRRAPASPGLRHPAGT